MEIDYLAQKARVLESVATSGQSLMRVLVGDVVSGVHLEKSIGTEHSVELKEYDRENAALTRAQKLSFRAAKRYGGTSSDVMKNHQADELAKPGGKRKADSTGVEGTAPGVEGMLHMA